MKNKILIIFLIIIVISLAVSNVYFINKSENKVLEEKEENNGSMAIMVETESGAGNYEPSEDSAWPSEGYEYNEKMTQCTDMNGEIIENALTFTNGKVKVKSNKKLNCYLYFDKVVKLYNKIIQLDNISDTGLQQTFVSTDTLYRFSGISGNTGINNYICLGTTSKCESGSDNMYRIIGIEPSTGYVKVIKETAINNSTTYKWNSSTGVIWNGSSLYYSTIKSYVEGLSIYTDKIVKNYTWNMGDIGSSSYITTSSNVILYESSGTQYTGAFGALSLTDYYLAYNADRNWYLSYDITTNWIGLYLNGNTSEGEWTMSRYSNIHAWLVDFSGTVSHTDMNLRSCAVRPTFFLKETVELKDGTGTNTDPFIIN